MVHDQPNEVPLVGCHIGGIKNEGNKLFIKMMKTKKINKGSTTLVGLQVRSLAPPRVQHFFIILAGPDRGP